MQGSPIIGAGMQTNCLFSRTAPVPVKVDGFSLGAVMGYSEQHTVVCLANDDDMQAFMKVLGLRSPGA